MVTDDERQAFSARLNSVLDDAGFAAKGSGRQLSLGKAMGVSQKGARKWLEGESIPETTRLIELARMFNVAFEWLATGRGDMRLPTHHEIPTDITVRAGNTYAVFETKVVLEHPNFEGKYQQLQAAMRAYYKDFADRKGIDKANATDAFKRMLRDLIVTSVSEMPAKIDAADEYLAIYRALAEAERNGVTNSEIAPIRQIIDSLTLLKKANIPPIQPIADAGAVAKSPSTDEVSAAIQSGIHRDTKGISENERPRGRGKKQQGG